MMRPRRASVIAALLLLTSAAMAYAECAWVLWRDTLPTQFPQVPDWQMIEAHPTVKECSSDLVHFGLTLQRRGYRVEGAVPGSRTATVANEQDPHDKGYLMCVPDTVDPRGPKGK